MRFALGSIVLVLVGGCGERSLPVAGGELADRLDRGLAQSAIVRLDASDDTIESFLRLKARVRSVAPTVEVLHTLEQLPLLAVRFRTRAELEQVLALPEILGVEAEAEYRTFDDLSLINQPAVLAAGLDGRGTTVAVIDTGVDWKRAAFGTCATPGAAGCKVAATVEVAPDDASLDDSGHGTNVAGIVLKVAPAARVVGLDVFANGIAKSTDLLAAMDWALTNRATYNIVAVNLSLGGSGSSTPCGDHSLETAFARARTVGIVAAVASGNDGFVDQLAWPGCSPSAVSVGAVYDHSVGSLATAACKDPTTAVDQVACFSNTASFLSVFAPGVGVNAAGITMTGTSQATPHVAGAAAVLRSAFPNESADQIVTRLVSSGVPVHDAKANVTRPRLDLLAATRVTTDTTPPVGSVRIGDGSPWMSRAAQTLTLTATDPAGVAQMCVTAAASCTTWEPFAATRAFTFSAGDGNKSVNAWFADARGNRSSVPTTAQVTLDTVAPLAGTVAAKPSGAGVLAIEWSGMTDLNGIARYAVYAASGQAPTACTGTAIYSGAETRFSHTGLAAGTTWGYRVCATDRAGNTSLGAIASATVPAFDASPPTGIGLSINEGAAYTCTTAVRVALVATDPSGVTACVSNDTTCTTFAALVPTRDWMLSSGDGVKLVSAWFRDGAGNKTPAPAQDTITLDTAPPSNPLLVALPTLGGARLSWSASTDATSGIDRYRAPGASRLAPRFGPS